MTSGQTYTSGSITLNAGYYLCYVSLIPNYSNSGAATTNITATTITFNGTGIAGGSTTDTIPRTIIYGIAYTYTLYATMQPLLVVPASTSVNVSYTPYFTFTTNSVGINAASNVTFIRLA
jgi:hypothetical protein